MHGGDRIPLCVSGQRMLGSDVGVNDYSEPSVVPCTLLYPHRTCLPIPPLAALLAQAALGLRIPAPCGQWAGEPMWSRGGGCTQGPCTNGFGVSKVRLPPQARKTFPGKGHGKGPPPAALPAPAAASWPSLASWAARVRRRLRLPEERCWAKAGPPQLPNRWEGVHRVVKVPGCVGRGLVGGREACMGCRRVCRVLGGEGGDGMLGRGEVCQLPAGQLDAHPIPSARTLTPTSALAASMEQRVGPPEPRPAGPTTHPQPKVSPGLAGRSSRDHTSLSPFPAHGASSLVWGPWPGLTLLCCAL